MTATVAEGTANAPAEGGVGRISRIIGPVVDVEFPADAMPEQYNLLTTDVELDGEKKNIFPFQENADVMFNSAQAYELAALRPLVTVKR